MVPLILMKIFAVRPERQPLLSGPRLKAQPPIPLIAQEEPLLFFLAVLSCDGSQVLCSVGGGIGIVSFKGARRHPHADGEGFPLYQQLFRFISDIVGAAVKQQASTGHALAPPLRGPGVHMRHW